MTSDSQWNKYGIVYNLTCYYVLCIFCSHQLTIVGKLVLLMTGNNGVNTVLIYCMKQMSNFITSGCETDEELVLTTILTVLKVCKFFVNILILKYSNKCTPHISNVITKAVLSKLTIFHAKSR